MNCLLLGVGDKTEEILARLQPPYLLIDDGPIIDAIKSKKQFVYFDIHRHSVDVLTGMNDVRAEKFVSVLDVLSPGGENTLTRHLSNDLIEEELLRGPKELKGLIEPGKDPYTQEAARKIRKVLRSPIRKNLLNGKDKVRLDTTVLVRLDRRKITENDALFVAHTLMMLYKFQVVVPDWGFYGRDYLTSLIREERLICGVQTLEELTKVMQQRVLLMSDKVGRQCTPKDAEALAPYLGLSPNKTGYKEDINDLIAG